MAGGNISVTVVVCSEDERILGLGYPALFANIYREDPLVGVEPRVVLSVLRPVKLRPDTCYREATFISIEEAGDYYLEPFFVFSEAQDEASLVGAEEKTVYGAKVEIKVRG